MAGAASAQTAQDVLACARSALAQQSASFDGLPPDALTYGVNNRRISPRCTDAFEVIDVPQFTPGDNNQVLATVRLRDLRARLNVQYEQCAGFRPETYLPPLSTITVRTILSFSRFGNEFVCTQVGLTPVVSATGGPPVASTLVANRAPGEIMELLAGYWWQIDPDTGDRGYIEFSVRDGAGYLRPFNSPDEYLDWSLTDSMMTVGTEDPVAYTVEDDGAGGLILTIGIESPFEQELLVLRRDADQTEGQRAFAPGAGANAAPTGPAIAVDPQVEAVRATYLAIVRQYPNDATILGDTIVEGEWALQDWVNDPAGGEALLRYDAASQTWNLVEAGGGAWNAAGLVEFGVPPKIAQVIISRR